MRNAFTLEIEPFELRTEFEPEATKEISADRDPFLYARARKARRRGSPSVRWVQRALNRVLGTRLTEDGVAGPKTRDVLCRFQQRTGLSAHGRADAATRRELVTALESLDNEFELETEVSRSSRDYIRWVQGALNRILDLRLATDGISGTQIRSAIRHFQQRQGLTTDGIVGSQTERALIAAGAGQPPPGTSGGTTTTTPDIVSVRGIQIARSIAPQVASLLNAARADGVDLGGWGYRSTPRQIELRRKHCGTSHYDIYEKSSSQCHPPTARPGRSMHERGLAIDFTYRGGSIGSHDSPGYQWLARNAERFGLYNLPSEPWHWSTTGT